MSATGPQLDAVIETTTWDHRRIKIDAQDRPGDDDLDSAMLGLSGSLPFQDPPAPTRGPLILDSAKIARPGIIAQSRSARADADAGDLLIGQ